jgi:hypothetical protein
VVFGALLLVVVLILVISFIDRRRKD